MGKNPKTAFVRVATCNPKNNFSFWQNFTPNENIDLVYWLLRKNILIDFIRLHLISEPNMINVRYAIILGIKKIKQIMVQKYISIVHRI